MEDLNNFYKARIEALERLNAIQADLIDEQFKLIDELSFKVADSKQRYNMLVRNIEVIDAEFEKPIKN